jgi:hypothetical protein
LGLKLPCSAELKKKYLQAMCEMTQGPLAADEILKVWNQTFDSLKAIVPLEKDFVWKGVDPMAASPNTATIVETFGSENTRIKAWIPERIKFVQAELGKLGVTCAATCTAGATSPCTHLGCTSQRKCENGRWTACQPVPCGAPPASDGGAPDGGTPMTDAGSSGTGGSSGGSGSGAGGSSSGTGGSSAGQTGGSSGSRGGSGGGSSSGSGGSSGGSSSGNGSSSSGGCDFGSAGGQPGSTIVLLLGFVVAAWRSRRSRTPQ